MPFPAHGDSSAATKLPPKCFNFAWALSWGLGDITQCWRSRSLERACKSSEPEIKSAEISFVKSQLQLYVKHETLARILCGTFYLLNFIFPFSFFFSLACVLFFYKAERLISWNIWNNNHGLLLFLRTPDPSSLLVGMVLQGIAAGPPTC